MKRGYLSLLLALPLAGCTNGSGGGGQAPASNVNSKVSASASKALSGQTAIFEVSRAMSGSNKGGSDLVSKIALRETMSASVQPSATKVVIDAKASKVNNVIRQGGCKIDLAKAPGQKPSGQSGQSGSVADQFAPLKMKIAGGSCPVEISFNVEMQSAGKNPCQEGRGSTACKFVGVMKMSYRVLDQRLADEIGVTSGHMNMAFDMDQTMPGAQQSGGQMNMAMKGKATVDMKAVDLEGQSYLVKAAQDVNMTMTMSSEQASAPQIFGSMKEDLQYLHEASGTQSVLSASVVMNGDRADEKYFVDGVAVTSAAYQAEREKFANSMLEFKSENGQGGGEPSGGPQPGTGYPEPTSGYPQPGSGYPQPTSGYPQPGSGFPQPGSGFPEPGSDFPQPGSGFPQPSPSTGSSDREWACMLEDFSRSDVSIGYGANEFIARTKAEQACRSNTDASCSSTATCAKQEWDSSAWYCRAKNASTGRIFDGNGASKVEALYFARKSCISASGDSASSCRSAFGSDCVHR